MIMTPPPIDKHHERARACLKKKEKSPKNQLRLIMNTRSGYLFPWLSYIFRRCANSTRTLNNRRLKQEMMDSRLKECSRKWSNKKINRCGDRTVILILILVIYSYISDFHMNSIHVEQVKGKMLETSSTIEHSEVNAFICHNSSTTTSWNTTNTTILLLSTRWKWTQRSKTLTIKQCSFPMVMANTMFSEQVVSLKPPYKT